MRSPTRLREEYDCELVTETRTVWGRNSKSVIGIDKLS